MRRLRIRLILFIFMLTAQTTQADTSSEPNYLSFADIHFDPFLSCHFSIRPCPLITQLQNAPVTQWESILSKKSMPLSQIGQDTNFSLLKITLANLRTVNHAYHPTFALAIGDFLVHNFHSKYVVYSHDFSRQDYKYFLKKTLSFITLELQNALPNMSIYPALGNNDSDGGDYNVVPNGSFLRETANRWVNLLRDPNERRHFLRDFSKAGYFAISPKQYPHHQIVVLNTVLFSINATGNNIDEAAKNQILWLHQKLTEARKNQQKVLLVFHIPPGVNTYAFFKNPWGKPETFWFDPYSQSFANEVKSFSDVIEGIFPAHIHRDILNIVLVKQIGNVHVYFTPSISPIFGNDPEFRLFTHSPSSLKPNATIRFIYPLQKNGNQYQRS